MKFVLTDVLTLTDGHFRTDPFIPGPCVKDTTRSPSSRADHVYFSVRDDIFDLRLLPGDRMTEGSIADRFGVSHKPAREALQRFQSDGLMRGYVRGGWGVVPIDFKRFEDLYEMRKLIETFSVSRLFGVDSTLSATALQMLDRLDRIWNVPHAHRFRDDREMVALDEAFHEALVVAAGNAELSAAMQRVTDRIRVVRRLDLVYGDCIDDTYNEHIAILSAVRDPAADRAVELSGRHIEGSRAEVRALTTERLQRARTALEPHNAPYAPPRLRGEKRPRRTVLARSRIALSGHRGSTTRFLLPSLDRRGAGRTGPCEEAGGPQLRTHAVLQSTALHNQHQAGSCEERAHRPESPHGPVRF
ncbi:DNA-binding GntR family transcriptional regulator [Paraburkholderia sp. UCT70]